MAIIKTPKGIVRYPYLNTPDTKFNADGDYKVTLVLDNNDETQALVATLTTLYEQALAEAKIDNPGKKIKSATLPINDKTEEGKTHISFRLKAHVIPRDSKPFDQKPALFDAKGNLINKVIGDGSTIRVAFEPIPFYTATVGAGLTFRLKAVQVLSLVPFDETSFSFFGFVQEDGYVDDSPVEKYAKL